MPSKIEDTYCINVSGGWCAVLGNYYPNFPSSLSLRQAEAIADGKDMESEPPGKSWCVQRLCDQTNVQYQFVLLCAPTCPDCLRIKGLMVEFATVYPEEREDDATATNGVSTHEHQGGQSDAAE